MQTNLQSHNFSSPQTITIVGPITNTCDFNLHPISSCQHFALSSTSDGARWLKLLIFIFHFLVVVLEHVNLVLLGSAGVSQPQSTNESHRTGGNNTGVGTNSHCLAL